MAVYIRDRFNYGLAAFRVDGAFPAVLEGELRDLDRLLAVLTLVRRLLFLPVVLGLVCLVLLIPFLIFMRLDVLILVALFAERRAGFSGIASTGRVAAAIAAGCFPPRPSPMSLAS